jgi:hypothetical protein
MIFNGFFICIGCGGRIVNNEFENMCMMAVVAYFKVLSQHFPWRDITKSLKLGSRRMSRGSSVSIVTDYELDDRGSIPDRGRGFFF